MCHDYLFLETWRKWPHRVDSPCLSFRRPRRWQHSEISICLLEVLLFVLSLCVLIVASCIDVFLVCAVRTPQKHAEIRHGGWFEKLSNTSEKIFSVGRKSKFFKRRPWQCAAPGTRILSHIHQLARGFCLKVTIINSTLLYNEIFENNYI